MPPLNKNLLQPAKINGTQRRMHKECIVHTVVCQKAALRMKQRQTMKNQAHNLRLHLTEGINQSVITKF